MIDFSPLTCPEVLDLLGQHLAGELAPATDARVIEHIRGCADCREPAATVLLPCDGSRADINDVEFQDISEDISGRDVMAFTCPKCGETHSSLVFG